MSEEKRGLDVFCRTGMDLVAVGCSLFTDLKVFVPLATSGLYQLMLAIKDSLIDTIQKL